MNETLIQGMGLLALCIVAGTLFIIAARIYEALITYTDMADGDFLPFVMSILCTIAVIALAMIVVGLFEG